MRTRVRILLQLIIDLLWLNLSLFIVAIGDQESVSKLLSHRGRVIFIINIAWIISYIIFIDDLSAFKSNIKFMISTTTRRFVLFIAVLFTILIAKNLTDFSHDVLFGTIALFFVFKLLMNLWLFDLSPIRNKPNMRPAIIIGHNSIGIDLYNYFQKNTYLALDPIGILDSMPAKAPSKYLLGCIEDFQKIYDNKPFQDVLIALPLSEKTSIKKVIDYAEKNGVRPHIVPNYFGIIDKAFQVQTLGNVPTLTYRSLPLDRYPNRFWKRAFDLTFSSIILLAASPFLLLIAIAIKLDSRGPVFYRPMRLGVNSDPFRLYKFRSMKFATDEVKNDYSTVKEDGRITRVGKIIRKYNLDELPQLLNVLKNEMSIVGPRPHRLSLNKSLQHKMKAYRVRHLVKPGISGWAQVNGYRGPMENRHQYAGRTLHDLWYLEHWSFWLDVYIIFLTVFSKKAYKNAF